MRVAKVQSDYFQYTQIRIWWDEGDEKSRTKEF